jgi:diguanylate cyclase (GGDEF)-like protein
VLAAAGVAPHNRPMATPAGIDTKRSLLAQVREQGFGRLNFPEPLESEFRAEWLAKSVRWVRLCLYVAIATSIGFSLIDHLIIKTSNALPDVVRYGLQMPVLFICLAATLWPAFRRWYPLAIQLGGPFYGLGTVLLIAFAQSDHTALVGSRLLLVCFFIFFMCGLRAVQALRNNLIILGLFIGAGIMGLIPAAIVTYLSFAYVVGVVIGTAGSYAVEHATRSSFLERRFLSEMAERDGLTQLLNRQTFEARARSAWQHASAQQQPVTMLMVDVDHFKLYNDQYGHQAGDDCLQRVANAVRSAIATHQHHLVARYGGEEIIAILPYCDRAKAQEVARQVVEQVSAMGISHAASADYVHVSVSVGAATQQPSSVMAYDALVHQADDALYRAKRQGRNRSVLLDAPVAA